MYNNRLQVNENYRKVFKASSYNYFMEKEYSSIRNFSLSKKLRGINRNDYGKIEKIRFIVLESKEKVSESTIEEMFFCVLVVFKRIIDVYNKDTLNSDDVEIFEVKTAKYKDALIKGETFAKIVIKVNEILIESFIGRAVGTRDNKKMEIFFERGAVIVDFGLKDSVKTDPPVKKDDKYSISELVEDIKTEFYKNAFLDLCCKIEEEKNEIDKIISKIRKKASEPIEYEKFSSPNKILIKFEKLGRRYEKLIDVLLNQYNDLRKEIVLSIHLEHWAIVGLYTSLGLAFAYLITGEITEKFELPDLLLLLVFIQIVANGFGSLFLKEQARNRRACSFQKAIEYIINKKIGGIGIYWENYITSKLITVEINRRDYFGYSIPINREYYKNRLLSVGLPIFLPNILATLVIGYNAWIPYGKLVTYILVGLICFISVALPLLTVKLRYYFCGFAFLSVVSSVLYPFFENVNWIFLVFFVISFAITLFWGLMIIFKTFSSLKKEGTPCRERVVAWLEEEYQNLL